MNSQISCCLPVSTAPPSRVGVGFPNVCSPGTLPLLPDVVKLPRMTTLEQDGHTFRDLNGNGRLDPYEDSRLPVEERVADLLAQMTLEEKVGLMFHQMTGMRPDGTLVEKRS